MITKGIIQGLPQGKNDLFHWEFQSIFSKPIENIVLTHSHKQY